MLKDSEKRKRWQAVDDLMERIGTDTFVVAGKEGAIGRGFIRYLSDWHLWGGVGYMLFQKGEEPVLILGSESQTMWAKEIGWVKNVVFQSPSVEGLISEIKKATKKSEISIAGLGNNMPYSDVSAIMKAFPEKKIIDSTHELEKIVMVKSEEEIAFLKETAFALQGAMEVFQDELKPGKTEREVVSKAWEAARKKGILDGIAHISHTFPPFIHPPVDRKIKKEDVIKFSMEMAGPSGYWLELSAVFSFMKPPKEQLEVFQTTLEAVEEVKRILVPGNSGKMVAEVVEKVFSKYRQEDLSRIIWDAHGIGLDVIEYPVIKNENHTTLKENMVISVHPGLTVGKDRLGFYIQDNYTVKPGGAEQHSKWEHKWHVID